MLATLSLVGQTRISGISGPVADSKDATIPGASGTVTNEATSVSQSGLTNDVGIYAFSLFPVETYSVAVEQADFKKFQRTGNELNVNTPNFVEQSFLTCFDSNNLRR